MKAICRCVARFVAALAGACALAGSAGAADLVVVSSRPDLVSGSEALVLVNRPVPQRAQLRVNRRDAPARLAPDEAGRLVARIGSLTAVAAGETRCSVLYPTHANPRIAAGMPLTMDVLKCRLTAVDPRAYAQKLTAEQLRRLRAVFPRGVCDFTKPGVGDQRLAATWLAWPAPGRPTPLPSAK